MAIVASCGYGQPYASEIWGVMVDRDTSAEAPIQLFTPRNSEGFSWRRAMPRLPDGLRVNFRDADLDYEPRQITVLRPGGSPRGVLQQVDIEGLVHEDDIRARALYDLGQPVYRGTYYTLNAPAEAIICRRGSLVAVQHDLIERHGALSDTLERARHYGAMARDALGLFPSTPLKSALLEAVDFAIDRAH